MPTPPLTPAEDAAWQGFLYTHDRIWRELEAGLASLGVTMAEYSVLALLADAGDKGMRMSELAQRRVMSMGGFTRLADRLEGRGLIARERVATDGRGYLAKLTPDGRAFMRAAWKRHYADLRRVFFDPLTGDELLELAGIWARLDPERTDDSRPKA